MLEREVTEIKQAQKIDFSRAIKKRFPFLAVVVSLIYYVKIALF